MYDIIIGRSEDDKEKYGTEGTVLLGKHYVKMGRTTSLSNKILLDVIRSHVIFVCGKRGGGKCLTGDSLITLSNGLEMPISELENNSEKVLGLDDNLKVSPFCKDDFFKREVSEILKIRLRSGKEIKLTPEHPLLTIKGWIPAKELSLGSKIATPRKIGFFGNETMRDEEIKLLAYLIAEGHTKKNILFSNSDKIIVNEFKKSVERFQKGLNVINTGKYCYKISSDKIKRKVLGFDIKQDKAGRFCKGSSITHEKTKIRSFLEEHKIYGLLATKKIISDKVFMLDKESLALFLNRLFSCDGSIYRHSKESHIWDISYASSSEKMIRQVQSLLIRFSVLSIIRRKKIILNDKEFESFELLIKGTSVITFIEEIGFFGKKKIRGKIALKEMRAIRRNSNIDIIPKEIWDGYRPKSWVDAGKNLNYSSPKASRSSINYSPSRQKLLQIALSDNNQEMKLIAESDLFWDEIVCTEKLEGNFTVYDISVPDTHNFIANNIIVHNSYTMGVIAEGISDLPPNIRNNISVIMLDTMGVYWTMKYPNKKDQLLLEEWGLEPKALDITIFTPFGYFDEYKEKGIPTDASFSIKPSELDGRDWCTTFGININESIGVFIERLIHDLRQKKKEFDLEDIISAIGKSSESNDIKNAALNLFLNAKNWGLFNIKGTPISELAKPGQVTVIDVSCYATLPGGWEIKSLVIGLIAQKLFIQRMIARKNEEFEQVHKSIYYFSEEEIKKLDFPMVWLIIDEAHEFIPKDGKTLATDPLITILREGRQPGISLILATQQPGKIHTDVMTQSDTIIAHRITAKIDTDALGSLMQSYLRGGLDKYLDDLPRVKGAAIVLDDSNEKMYSMRVRPRFTWHGGSAPTAIQDQDKIFEK